MRVQHNMAAMNTNRQLGINVSNQAKSTEKLSSGYRINRAGDDAAGLSISEKMRAQIRGLDQASTNAQDGISLIQTAEGALNETHSILQRMSELATQAANDTNVTADREAIQKEIDALVNEVNRISSETEFNEMKLLNGSVELGPIVELGDVIVDIVETGSTLRENGLEVLEEICPLSARMIVNQVSMQMYADRIKPLIANLKKELEKEAV